MSKNVITMISLLVLFGSLISGCSSEATPTGTTVVETATEVVNDSASEPNSSALYPEPETNSSLSEESGAYPEPETASNNSAYPAAESIDLTPAISSDQMVLVTTNTIDDSGLLSLVLPTFEDETNSTVGVISYETSDVYQAGKDGNADVLLVNDKTLADTFVSDGDGLISQPVFSFDYVIIGPASDPAGIQGLTSAADAFQKISETQSSFLSTGEDSETNTKELEIWSTAQISPSGDWYDITNTDISDVITQADVLSAYTLCDRAAFLESVQNGVTLQIMVEGDVELQSTIYAISVNPDKDTGINADLAGEFMDWILSDSVQTQISTYGTDIYGENIYHLTSE